VLGVLQRKALPEKVVLWIDEDSLGIVEQCRLVTDNRAIFCCR